MIATICAWIAAQLPWRLMTRGDNEPYLMRHYFKRHAKKPRDWWGNLGLYLHCFLVSDDAEFHNHPFEWSVSLILSGGYFEDRYVNGKIVRRTLRPCMINVIRDNDFHRVDLRGKRCWTLFLAGTRTQDWGFLDVKTGEFTQHDKHIAKRGLQ